MLSRWTSVLAPVAAVLAIVFAGLAYRAARPQVEARVEPFEIATCYMPSSELDWTQIQVAATLATRKAVAVGRRPKRSIAHPDAA